MTRTCLALSISVLASFSSGCQVLPDPVVIERYDCRIDDPALVGPVWKPVAPAEERTRTTFDVYRDAKQAFAELERVDADHERIRNALKNRGCLDD